MKALVWSTKASCWIKRRSCWVIIASRQLGAGEIAGWSLIFEDCLFPRQSGNISPMPKTPKKAKRTPNAAFMKPVQPDEKLALVVGEKPLPRTELTKKLWAYIRKNGLQDAKKRP